MTTHRHFLESFQQHVPSPPSAAEIAAVAWLHPTALAAVLGGCQPTAPLLTAARAGVQVADLRHAHWGAVRDTAKQVAGAYRAAGLARRPSLAEIERHRWAPTGHRADWLLDSTTTTTGPTTRGDAA